MPRRRWPPSVPQRRWHGGAGRAAKVRRSSRTRHESFQQLNRTEGGVLGGDGESGAASDGMGAPFAFGAWLLALPLSWGSSLLPAASPALTRAAGATGAPAGAAGAAVAAGAAASAAASARLLGDAVALAASLLDAMSASGAYRARQDASGAQRRVLAGCLDLATAVARAATARSGAASVALVAVSSEAASSEAEAGRAAAGAGACALFAALLRLEPRLLQPLVTGTAAGARAGGGGGGAAAESSDVAAAGESPIGLALSLACELGGGEASARLAPAVPPPAVMLPPPAVMLVLRLVETHAAARRLHHLLEDLCAQAYRPSGLRPLLRCAHFCAALAAAVAACEPAQAAELLEPLLQALQRASDAARERHAAARGSLRWAELAALSSLVIDSLPILPTTAPALRTCCVAVAAIASGASGAGSATDGAFGAGAAGSLLLWRASGALEAACAQLEQPGDWAAGSGQPVAAALATARRVLAGGDGDGGEGREKVAEELRGLERHAALGVVAQSLRASAGELTRARELGARRRCAMPPAVASGEGLEGEGEGLLHGDEEGGEEGEAADASEEEGGGAGAEAGGTEDRAAVRRALKLLLRWRVAAEAHGSRVEEAPLSAAAVSLRRAPLARRAVSRAERWDGTDFGAAALSGGAGGGGEGRSEAEAGLVAQWARRAALEVELTRAHPRSPEISWALSHSSYSIWPWWTSTAPASSGGAGLVSRGAVSEPSRNLPAGEQRRRVADLLWTSLCTDGPQNGLGADSEVPVPSRPLETLLSSPPPPAAADSADAGGTAARAACVSVTVASISRAAVDCAALYELPGEIRPRCARDAPETCRRCLPDDTPE